VFGVSSAITFYKASRRPLLSLFRRVAALLKVVKVVAWVNLKKYIEKVERVKIGILQAGDIFCFKMHSKDPVI